MDEFKKQVDMAKVKKLKNIIIMKESKNILTKEINDENMIKELYKLIKEDIQCYSNQ